MATAEEIKQKLADWWKAPNKEIYVKWVDASRSNGGRVKFVVWFDEQGNWYWKMRNAYDEELVANPAVYRQKLANLLGITVSELKEHWR